MKKGFLEIITSGEVESAYPTIGQFIQEIRKAAKARKYDCKNILDKLLSLPKERQYAVMQSYIERSVYPADEDYILAIDLRAALMKSSFISLSTIVDSFYNKHKQI